MLMLEIPILHVLLKQKILIFSTFLYAFQNHTWLVIFLIHSTTTTCLSFAMRHFILISRKKFFPVTFFGLVLYLSL